MTIKIHTEISKISIKKVLGQHQLTKIVYSLLLGNIQEARMESQNGHQNRGRTL